MAVSEAGRMRFVKWTGGMAGAALALIFLSAPAHAERRGDQGLGVMLGNPSGFSYKIFLNERVGVDAAFGVAQGELDTHVTVLFHDFDFLRRSPALSGITAQGELPVYFGVGPRLLFADDDTELGVRLPVGVSFFPHEMPWETFFEVAPVVRLAPTTGLDLDFALGVRYYFPAIRPRH